MIKRILIPLDPSPYTDSALEIGTAMAKINNARLTGLVVLDIPGIEKSIGPVPLGGLYYAEKMEKAHRQKAETRIHELLQKFRQKCESAGVEFQEAELQGSPSERIIRESIFYDAIIIGMRTYFHFETQDTPGDSLEKVLDQTITPVYAVPEKLVIPHLTDEKMNVLIAFDGSLPSARAMQRFAQLAPVDVFNVRLLISEPDEKKAHYYLNQAEIYLNCHNVNQVQQEWIREDIIEAIDENYLDWAHILVVGAHSKSGLFGFKVGSLTRHLIKLARKTILIGQ
ncbi:MAG: universal stress protein [Calditrichaeota bacterium]|nr:MAG: universal stress protein [Calditrichota bacterium]